MRREGQTGKGFAPGDIQFMDGKFKIWIRETRGLTGLVLDRQFDASTATLAGT
jgi:hypothetical protein